MQVSPDAGTGGPNPNHNGPSVCARACPNFGTRGPNIGGHGPDLGTRGPTLVPGALVLVRHRTRRRWSRSRDLRTGRIVVGQSCVGDSRPLELWQRTARQEEHVGHHVVLGRPAICAPAWLQAAMPAYGRRL